MTKIYLQIKPFDTLFFRTGTPFGGGEVSWTESSLLPNPSVIWGAVYSMMIAHGLVDKDIEEDQKKLSVGRVFIHDGRNEDGNIYDRLLLPLPQDIYKYKESEKNGVFVLKANQKVLSNYKGDSTYLLLPQNTDEVIENIGESYLDSLYFSESTYLEQRNDNSIFVVSQNTLFEKSHKVGIARDNTTHNAEEGKLYRINTTQFKKGVSLVVEVKIKSNLYEKFPNEGCLKLGGENKAVTFSKYAYPTEITEIETIIKQSAGTQNLNYLRVYLHSATFFNSGDGIKEIEENGEFKVLTCCFGKPVFLGGFDVKENKPKAMRKGVPSGSIYYLKSNLEKGFEETKSKLEEIFGKSNKGYGLIEVLPLKIK